MARKAIYKHATQVNTSTYPDDGSSPVGSNEWNEAPDPAGMLGFTAQTIASATSITPTNSVIILSGSTNVSTIAVAETNEYDLLYVVTSGSVTLVNTSSPSSSGDIRLIADANKDLSTTTPTILMRKGTAWYEYGGGGSSTPTDITVADSTDTTCFPALFESATGDLAPKTDAGITYNAGTGVLTATGFAGPITGNVTGNASGSSATCSGLSATATALATARTIGGTSFDGTANIAVALSATTTALATARTIGGTSFDGTANIAVGLSATATEATNVTAVANNSTDETVYPTFVDGATGTQGIETDTGFTYNPSTGLVTAVGLTLSGDLTVSGTTTTINSTTLTVDDKNIEMGSVDTPSDTTADGGGLTLKGATDKTIIWDNANDNWTSNQDWNIASGKVFKINNVDVKNVAETLTNKTLTAPTLTTPALGTPASGVLTNCTALPAAQVAQGTMASGMVLVAPALGTPASGVLTNATGLVATTGLTASGTKNSTTFLRGDNTWAAAGGGNPSDDVDYSGDYDIEDLQRACFEIQSSSFDSDGTNNNDRTGEAEMYVRTIDSNNDGLFIRIKKNGSNQYLQIA